MPLITSFKIKFTILLINDSVLNGFEAGAKGREELKRLMWIPFNVNHECSWKKTQIVKKKVPTSGQ